MSIIHKSLRAPGCRADHPNYQSAVASAPQVWEVHVGTVQLFISGPGPDAWLACSESCYSGKIGTEEEWNIARRAVALLNREHREDKDAGPEEIRAALSKVAGTSCPSSPTPNP